MWKDPVVEGVRALRDEYAQSFDYDLSKICEDLRDKQSKNAQKVVTLPSKTGKESSAA